MRLKPLHRPICHSYSGLYAEQDLTASRTMDVKLMTLVAALMVALYAPPSQGMELPCFLFVAFFLVISIKLREHVCKVFWDPPKSARNIAFIKKNKQTRDYEDKSYNNKTFMIKKQLRNYWYIFQWTNAFKLHLLNFCKQLYISISDLFCLKNHIACKQGNC